jgi:hypothetical protein
LTKKLKKGGLDELAFRKSVEDNSSDKIKTINKEIKFVDFSFSISNFRNGHSFTRVSKLCLRFELLD